MDDQFSTIAPYPMLRDDQRIEARQAARDNLMARLGGEPQFSDFERRQSSRFGPTADRIGTLFILVVLASAFFISALHIFNAGRRASLSANPDATIATLIGGAWVLLAESGVLAMMTLPTLYGFSRRAAGVLYAVAGMCAFVAWSGNIDAVLLYDTTPFDWFKVWLAAFSQRPAVWLLSVLPPALTLAIGWSIKQRLMNTAETRHKAEIEYREALVTWRRTVARLEEHTDWPATLAAALWDAWKRGKRRDMLAEITDDTRREILRRELAADQFFATVTMPETPAMLQPETPAQAEETPTVFHVKQHLLQHPEDLDLSLRALGDKLGVSHSTVRRARLEVSNNGHN